MAVLTFTGNQVGAQFSLDEDQGNTAKWNIGQTPFQATDIVRIEVNDADIGPDGEFDPHNVRFESFSVERDGTVHNFGVNVGAKIKESGDGSNIEQGESFFVTNDSVSPPASGPFAGLSTQTYLFSTETTFDGGPDDYGLRRFGNVDLNGDGDISDPGETGDGNFNVTPVCFTPGTMILTPDGERPVEILAVGDLVETGDDGPQIIRWIGERVAAFHPDHNRHKPIQIKAGALGGGLPRRAMAVSPQHRMLIAGPVVRHLFGEDEVLAPAKGLTGLPGVRVMKGKRRVTYLALLLDRHHVLTAEGAKTESFYPGPTAMQMLPLGQRSEIRTIFPRLRDDPDTGYGAVARRVLTRKEAQMLAVALRERERNLEMWDRDLADEGRRGRFSVVA